MERYINTLTKQLMAMNPTMTQHKAQTWIELLWSDYEATSAKAGYDYKGAEQTAQLVQQLITSYGDKLHLFASKNPKFIELLEQ
ncbi:hypothetical protein GCM10007425_28700 [Lysinibacillus alkalisoli]|uniref:WVELL protein n=1 Tax=Lysinibacillus alkalisoli TaxID=1911548 RepID=A0A917G9V1_9BACI|nr:YfhJ family protein [Lysinibacillus alkalisoli]GGG32313.1 hypothetical protein GCM10007425_28700 [Lysinibacillus alkalisoli]